jgi:hypothetical protein
MAKDNILGPEEESLSLEGEEAPISLVDSEGAGGLGAGGLKTFGVQDAESHKKEYRRPVNVNGTGATRCRVFHSKIAPSSLEFMENQINEWVDSEGVEIKHIGHIIGIMEGKRPEPNLLVMVWY